MLPTKTSQDTEPAYIKNHEIRHKQSQSTILAKIRNEDMKPEVTPRQSHIMINQSSELIAETYLNKENKLEEPQIKVDTPLREENKSAEKSEEEDD